MNTEPPVGRHLRYILVVDADQNERFTMGMLLQRFGYLVCMARSASEAVEYLCVAPAMAVFSEGGAAGRDLLERLGADARFRNLPVVLVGDPNEPADRKTGSVPWPAGYLRMPLSADDVYRTVQRVIERGTRSNIRIATRLPALLTDAEGTTDGHITVLSQYGLFFRTLEPRPVSSLLQIAFSLWGRSIRLEATALYAVAFDEGPFREPGMGMKFTKIGAEDSLLVRAYIHEYLGEVIVPLGAGEGYRGGVA